MKTNNVLKIGFLAAAFVMLSVGVKAQTNANYVVFGTGTPESIDTVTVGSRMPYYVALQTAVAGLSFEYKWVVGSSLPILNYTGAAATAGTGPGYYTNNEISVVMPAAPGTITISTNVQSLSGATVLCPAGADDTYNIQVVPVPTLVWKNTPEQIQCLPLVADVPIDIQLTGYGQWMVDYSIVKSDLDGANPGSAVNKTNVAVGATKNAVGTTATDFQLLVAQSDFSGAGLYTITITKLTDRISRKSLSDINGALPGSTFAVKLYPTPTTNPLQHVKNIMP